MKSKSELKFKQDRVLGDRDEDWDDPILKAKDETLGFLLGDMDSIVMDIETPPTNNSEIDAMIVSVKKEYENLPEFSVFGDPNWKVRDTMIEMLEWAKGY